MFESQSNLEQKENLSILQDSSTRDVWKLKWNNLRFPRIKTNKEKHSCEDYTKLHEATYYCKIKENESKLDQKFLMIYVFEGDLSEPLKSL